jgi:hypothetical protein
VSESTQPPYVPCEHRHPEGDEDYPVSTQPISDARIAEIPAEMSIALREGDATTAANLTREMLAALVAVRAEREQLFGALKTLTDTVLAQHYVSGGDVNAARDVLEAVSSPGEETP